ncbi:Prolow-density lipoprotein receptor-related protein 1 [Orchesella cincta]|uniref:Prolow-density lipoprotein receptor-related protein 1 n=1 Tax=Orchesella cincta TaxID=48709 RepID=A0A1D2MJC7_ORCCI|nr:Prolow-density lipoprotein receptor-related protein 1 [Orchesella cincta]
MSSSFAEKISIAAYGMSGVPLNIISAHDQIYFVPNYGEVRVGPKLKYKKSNEYGMWGVITLLNRTVSSDVWNLLLNHECSVKSVRYKRCSHICIVSNSGEFLGDCRCPDGFVLGEDNRNCVKLPVCDKSQFTCHDSKCIDKNLTCDGIPDCSSEEDENDENCKDKLDCPINMFHCGKENEPGQCIPAAWQCDGKAQCEDRSDEKCLQFSCSENQVYCESKDSCVEKSWICARKYSCAGVDFNEVCEGFPCDSDHFMCAYTQMCVATHWFCDGTNDCQDMSDEPHYCQEYNSRG